MRKIFLIIALVLICAGVGFARGFIEGGQKKVSLVLSDTNKDNPYEDDKIVLTLLNMGNSYEIEIESSNMGGYALLRKNNVYEDLLLIKDRILTGTKATEAEALFNGNNEMLHNYEASQLQIDESVRDIKCSLRKNTSNITEGYFNKTIGSRIKFLLPMSTFWENHELLFIKNNGEIIYINFDLKRGFFKNEAFYLAGLKNSINENYTTKVLSLLYIAFGDKPEADFAKTQFLNTIGNYSILFYDNNINLNYIENAEFDSNKISENQKYNFMSYIRLGFKDYYIMEFDDSNSPYLVSHDYFSRQFYDWDTRNPYIFAYNLFLYDIKKPALSGFDSVNEIKWNEDSFKANQIMAINDVKYTKTVDNKVENIIINGNEYFLNELLVRNALFYYNWGVEYQLNSYHNDLNYSQKQIENTHNKVFQYAFKTDTDGNKIPEFKDTFSNWFKRGGTLGSIFNNYIDKIYLSESSNNDFTYTEYVKEILGFEGFYFIPPLKVFGNTDLVTIFSGEDNKRYFGNPIPYVHMGLDSPRTFNHKMYNQWNRLNKKDNYTTLPENNNFANYFGKDEPKSGSQPFTPGESDRKYKGSEAGVDSLGFITGISSISGLINVDINGDNSKLEKMALYFNLITEDNRPYWKDPDPEGIYANIRLTLAEIENNSILVPDPIFIQKGDLLIDNSDPDDPHIGVVVRAGGEIYVLSTSKQLQMMTLGRFSNNHSTDVELSNKVFNGFSMHPERYQIRRLIQYSNQIPKQNREAISWDLLRVAEFSFVVDIDMPDSEPNKMSHWIPNTKISDTDYETLEFGGIKLFKQLDDTIISIGSDKTICVVPPVDRGWKASIPDSDKSSIYNNRGDGIELVAIYEDENGDDIVTVIAKFERNAAPTKKEDCYTIVDSNIIDETGKLKGENKLELNVNTLIFNSEDHGITSRFGVRVFNDKIRPGDDFLLRFKIEEEDRILESGNEDFIAVYDKKMIWRASLYVDDGEAADWNDQNPWIIGNEWNKDLDDNIGDGKQVLSIPEWTRYSDNAPIKNYVAYNWGDRDSPLEFVNGLYAQAGFLNTCINNGLEGFSDGLELDWNKTTAPNSKENINPNSGGNWLNYIFSKYTPSNVELNAASAIAADDADGKVDQGFVFSKKTILGTAETPMVPGMTTYIHFTLGETIDDWEDGQAKDKDGNLLFEEDGTTPIMVKKKNSWYKTKQRDFSLGLDCKGLVKKAKWYNGRPYKRDDPSYTAENDPDYEILSYVPLNYHNTEEYDNKKYEEQFEIQENARFELFNLHPGDILWMKDHWAIVLSVKTDGQYINFKDIVLIEAASGILYEYHVLNTQTFYDYVYRARLWAKKEFRFYRSRMK